MGFRVGSWLGFWLILFCIKGLCVHAVEDGKNGTTRRDPCRVVSSHIHDKLPIKPSEFKSCLRVFPWKKKQAVKVLDTMWKTLVNIYPYTNLVKNSPTPEFPLKVRLRKRLIDLKAKKFIADFDFHKELSLIVESLEDGHTSWEPECYTNIAILTAFPLVKTFDAVANESKITITPLVAMESLEDSHSLGAVFKHTTASLGQSIELFAGAQVIAVNGVPVLDFVENFAKSVGDYRDQQARINTLFFRPSFSPGNFFPGSLMKLPDFFLDNDYVNYTVKRVNESVPEVIQVPYFVYYKGKKFNDSASYYAINCEAVRLTSSRGKNGSGASREAKIRQNEPLEVPSLKHKQLEIAQFENTGFLSLSNKSEDVQVYLLEDNITAVMTIPDFLGHASRNSSLSSIEAVIAYLEELLLAYNRVKLSGAQRLIIDVSNNGGGFVVTGNFLTQLLFPESGDPQFVSQLRAAAFGLAAYQKASFRLSKNTSSDYDYAIWQNPVTRMPFEKPSDFFLPLVQIRQFDITTNFSSHFMDKSYFEIIKKFNPFILPTKNLFDPKNIIVLSNGLCFSTCGVFSYQLRQLHDVKFVTVGGRDSSGPFAIAAGTVGFVNLDFNYFYQTEVVDLGLENETFSPKPLPLKGRLRWTMAQAFGPKSSTVPQEFIYEPGQIKLHYSEDNVLSPPNLWRDVSLLF